VDAGPDGGPGPTGGGNTLLVAENSGKCIGINGSGTSSGTRIYQFTCDSSAGQIWQFVSLGSGVYELRNPNSGQCATASGTANVSLFSIQTCSAASTQTFTLKLFGGVYYQLINTGSSRCWDVRGNSSADGTDIELYDCDFNAPAYNQAFKFVAP
jgi:hypothetical protein